MNELENKCYLQCFPNHVCIIVGMVLIFIADGLFGQERDTAQAQKLIQAANLLLDRSEYDSAMIYFDESSAIFLNNEDWHGYFRARNKIAETHYYKSEYNYVIGLCEELSAQAILKLGENAPVLADIYSNAGAACNKAGKTEDAGVYYLKAYEIRKNSLGPDHPETAVAVNNLGVYYYKQQEYHQALDFFFRSLEIKKRLPDKDTGSIAQTLSNIGTMYSCLGDLKNELHFKMEALNLQLKYYGENHRNVARSYNNLGYYYDQKGYYEDALNCYRKSLEINLLISPDDNSQIANNYNNIGKIYYETGDYDKAIFYHRKSLSINLALYGEKHRMVSGNYNNLGSCYNRINETDTALIFFNKALGISQGIYGENNLWSATILNNIAINCELRGDYRKQLHYLELAHEIWQNKHGEFHPLTATSFHNMAKAYANLGKDEESKEYYLRSIAVRKQIFGDKNDGLATSYRMLGKQFEKNNEFDRALENYQLAIISLMEDFSNPDPVSNPELHGIYSKIDLLNALTCKAGLFLILAGNENPEYAPASYDTYKLCVDLVEQIVLDYSFTTREFTLDKYYPVFEGAVESSIMLCSYDGNKKHLEEAFVLAERGSSALLKDALRDIDARQFTGIPDSIILKERELKAEIFYCHGKYRQSVEENDSAKTAHWQDRLFICNKMLEQHTEMLYRVFPSYYRLKYERDHVKVHELMENLKAKTVLLKYFLTEKVLYTFVITSESFQLATIPLPDDFSRIVEDYHRTLSDFSFICDSSDYADSVFAVNSSILFSILLEEPLQLSDNPENLIIIPDEILGRIPFEALIMTGADKLPLNHKEQDYVMNRYTISYAFSADLLFAETKSGEPAGLYCGFAPGYLDSDDYSDVPERVRNGLTPLPASITEVKTIGRRLNGDIWTGRNATEYNFKDKAKNYRMIHLAMHGCVDDFEPAYSNLVFDRYSDSIEDGILYTAELYNMELNADLAVLSACNTGSGVYRRGEGIISLSRAFGYAGVPSMVMSLWTVPDEASSRIMISFYEKLQKGMSKDQALRSARIDYLRNTRDPLLSHPFFWAGFVQIGNTSPVSFTTGGTGPVLFTITSILSGLLLILLIYSLLKKTRQKA